MQLLQLLLCKQNKANHKNPLQILLGLLYIALDSD